MRTLWTLVGIGIWLLGASPVVWAQGAASVTVTACLPCHSEGAAGAPSFPKLDGQHAAYLDKQLREYKTGKRKSATMAPLIGALKKQQIPLMAAHFASQTAARGVAENPQLAARGKVLYRGGQPRHRCAGVCRLSPAQWGGLPTLSPPRRPASSLHRAATGGLQERRTQQRPGARHARRGWASHRRGDQSRRRVCRRVDVKVPTNDCPQSSPSSAPSAAN